MNVQLARRTLRILDDVLQNGAYVNLALKNEPDALVTRWVYTTLEHLLLLDHWIDALTQGKRVQRVTRQVLRMGLAAVMYMRAPDSAVCNACVALMKQTGKSALSGFVNAVLRRASAQKDALEQPEGDGVFALSLRHNWPQWIIEMWREAYGEAVMLDMLRYSPPQHTAVRCNPLVMSEEEGISALRQEYSALQRGRIVPQALYLPSAGGIFTSELFSRGAVTAQGEAAMLCAKVVEPKRGMRILDACAAPGGKSAYMAAEMGNEGEVLALDVHAHRVALIDATCGRLHAGIVKSMLQDAAVFVPQWEAAFDAVLVDAPCSGLGVAHQKPDIRFRVQPTDIGALAQTQRRILDTCARYVRRGGALVYATCTLSREENEHVAQWFDQTHEGFLPDSLSRFFPPGFPQERLARGRVQLFPHMDNTEGFFIARWIRI